MTTDLELRLEALGKQKAFHLAEGRDLGHLIRMTIREAHSTGMSVRRIAELLRISKTRVHVLLGAEQ